MGKLFNKKPKKEETVMAAAPNEPETKEEMEYTKNLAESEPTKQEPIMEETVENQIPEYKEIPVCMSQTQINNMVIDNNIMLKYIVSKIEG